jgi:hypothetical protein
MKVSELRKRVVRVEVQSVQTALAAQDTVLCTHLSPKPGEPRDVFRHRTLVIFGIHKKLPLIFDKRTPVNESITKKA